MNGFIKTLAADKIIKWSTLASVLLQILGMLYVLFLFRMLPPYLPLYNQLPWGEDRLGQSWQIVIPFLLTTTFLMINLILASWLYNKMPLVSRILGVTGLLVSLLLCIFVFRMIQLFA